MINTTKEVLSNFKNIVLNEGKESPVKYTDPSPMHLRESPDETFQYLLNLLALTPVTAWGGFIWAKSVIAGTGFLKEFKAAASKDEKKKVISKYFSREALNYVLDPTNLFKYVEGVPDVKSSNDKSLDEVLDALISGEIKPTSEQPEEGTSISLSQLEDICRNVEIIKSQIAEGDIVPDWALQHISVAADNIHEVAVFFEGEEDLESPEEQDAEDIHMIGEAGKASGKMTKKEKSKVVKDIKAGKQIGKPEKGFKEVEKKAEKEYGSKKIATKVAAAAMWKQQAKKSK
jgi:hypothetical protein